MSFFPKFKNSCTKVNIQLVKISIIAKIVEYFKNNLESSPNCQYNDEHSFNKK